MTPVLDDLFRCPAAGKLLAVKHCLRRQDERRDVLDAKGKVLDQVVVRAECQGCAVGAEHRTACGPLPASRPAEAVPPLTGRPLPPEHLWTSEVPDVPLGPPPTEIRAHPWYGPEGEARARPGEPESLLDGEDEAVELEAPGTPHVEVGKRVVHPQPSVVAPVSPRPGRAPTARPEVVHPAEFTNFETAQPAAPPPEAPPAAAAPPPTQENEMPCKTCKKTGHNARSCPDLLSVERGPVAKTTPRKLAAAQAREEARPRPPRRGKPVDDLDGLEERLQAELEAVDLEVQEVETRGRELRERRARLHRVLEALGAGAEPAQTVG